MDSIVCVRDDGPNQNSLTLPGSLRNSLTVSQHMMMMIDMITMLGFPGGGAEEVA